MKKTLQTLTLLTLFAGTIISPALANDVFVNTSAQLKNACDNAVKGDIIKIAAGTYTGPFTLDSKRNVTLQSYNGIVTLLGNPDQKARNGQNSSDAVI